MEPSLSPPARVVVTASSVHNPATGDPGKQATLGVGAQVFHVFPWIWHGKSMENRWTCASEMASKLKIGDFNVVWGWSFGKFRWNSDEQERNSLLIQDVGGIIQMKDARISSCWSWKDDPWNIVEWMLIPTEHQKTIWIQAQYFFLPYPSDSLYHWYIVTMKRQESSDFGVFFSHRRSWGDLSGLGKDKVGMVDGSTFDAGKAYKGGDGNCGLGRWWKLFTGKMKLLDNYWLRFCCYACSQHCYICSDWSNQYQSIESIITPLNMLSQQSIEATNVSVQLVTSISLVIVTFLQIPSSATCSSPWSSLAACALSVK